MGRKLTSGEVARELNINSYTLKRWYAFWEELEKDVVYLDELVKGGMPVLPKYEVVGNRGDRIWDEEDLEELKEFQAWIPKTKNGIFAKVLMNRKVEK